MAPPSDARVTLAEGAGLPMAEKIRERIEEIAGSAHVRRIAGLPDIHLKPRMEAPSSFAVATEGVLSAQLSSPSPNCGMALVATDVSAEELRPHVETLFTRLRDTVPMKRSPQALSTAEAVRAMGEGVEFGVRGADAAGVTPERYDDGGRRDALTPGMIKTLMPDDYVERARLEFGALGGGNHFLELEEVVEIFDEEAAAVFGLRLGQAVYLYHSDSGGLGYRLGRLYAHRSKARRRSWPRTLAHKSAFHLSHGDSIGQSGARMNAFVRPRRYAWLDEDEAMAGLLVAAYAAGVNYAWANRAAVAAAIAAATSSVASGATVQLVTDASHNSITKESGLWVHRHNATHVTPPAADGSGPFGAIGRPVLLSGTDRSSTYVCRVGPTPEATLFSADHGAGGSQSRLASAALPGAPTTRRFHHDGRIYDIAHGGDEGILAVAGALQSLGVLAPVVRTQPIAVLKQ